MNHYPHFEGIRSILMLMDLIIWLVQDYVKRKKKLSIIIYLTNQTTSVETQKNWPNLINTGEAMQWLWRGACRYR